MSAKMKPGRLFRLVNLGMALSLVVALPAAPADNRALSSMVRDTRCAGSASPAQLRPTGQLDQAAQLWSTGRPLQEAMLRAGYRADEVQGLRISGSDAAARDVLRRQLCDALRAGTLRELGVHQSGSRRWVILARAYDVPGAAQAPAIARRVLLLANRARSVARRCGGAALGPAGPLQLSATLTQVAGAHARELAERNALDHRGRDGSTAGQRVRAAGYHPAGVGENIAVGPTSAEEVMSGWLASPGHCANLMSPAFTELGIAYADGGPDKAGLYWVQVLASPAAKAR
jgi:uncharacterized protein YkwD